MKKILIPLLLLLSACGGSSLGTGVGNPITSKTSKAIAAIFSTSSESANISELIKNGKIKIVETRTDPSCTGSGVDCMCADLIAGSDGGTPNVNEVPFGEAGTYGSALQNVDLEADDFCALETGEANTGSGPDELGLFGAFEVTVDTSTTCDDGETYQMLSGSGGIFRNVIDESLPDSFGLEIYGTFTIASGDESAEVNCYMLMSENTIVEASCSDETGAAITQDEEGSCEIVTE